MVTWVDYSYGFLEGDVRKVINYVRPHMGLDGKTPAEAAGINVEGRTNGLR